MNAAQIAARLRKIKHENVDGKRLFGYGPLIGGLFDLVAELADHVATLETKETKNG